MTDKSKIKSLEKEVSRLRHELLTQPDIVEPEKLNFTPDESQIPIFIVWAIGIYPNGIKHLDLRSVTTSMAKAKLYSRMLRANKELERGIFERVLIEQRIANHLYGAEFREMAVNTGQL